MEILSNKIVKTNKPHMCFACGRRFEKGTQMIRQVNTCDGLCVVYSCKTCDELMTKHPKLFWDDRLDLFNAFCVIEALKK